MHRKTRKLAVAYLVFQTIVASLWWLAMLLRPEWRAWFFVDPNAEMHWMSFLLPDLVFIVGAGWLAAVGLRHEHRWGWAMLVLHAGGVGYAALFSLATTMISGVAWPGTLLMLGSFVAVTWFCRRLRPQ